MNQDSTERDDMTTKDFNLGLVKMSLRAETQNLRQLAAEWRAAVTAGLMSDDALEQADLAEDTARIIEEALDKVR